MASCMKMNGMTTGKVEINTQQEHRECAEPVILVQTRARGRLGRLNHPLADYFQFGRLKHIGNFLGQRVGNRTMRFRSNAGAAHRAQGENSLSAFAEATHEIHHAVDNPPGEIAAQRPDQHFANIGTARLGSTERTGEGENHDQAKQHFRNAIDRIQQLFGFLRVI